MGDKGIAIALLEFVNIWEVLYWKGRQFCECSVQLFHLIAPYIVVGSSEYGFY